MLLVSLLTGIKSKEKYIDDLVIPYVFMFITFIVNDDSLMNLIVLYEHIKWIFTYVLV